MRVVSLVPSATESLLHWGVVPVACTRFCCQPELDHVGGTKDPDLDAIVALRPDLVVMCEEENLLAHHELLVEAGIETFTFRIDCVDDVAPQLAALAGRLEVGVAGVAPGSGNPGDLSDAGNPGDLAVPARSAPRARAFVPIWRRPWMTLSGSTYGSSLLAAAGIDNVYADAASRYPEVDLDAVRARRPDVVLAPTEPYPFAERHLDELAWVAPARLVDGQDLFWWGVRTPAAMRRLRESLAEVVRSSG